MKVTLDKNTIDKISCALANRAVVEARSLVDNFRVRLTSDLLDAICEIELAKACGRNGDKGTFEAIKKIQKGEK